MSELFVSFYMLKIEIERALGEHDSVVANQVKQEQSILLDKIISINPETMESRRMLGLFLLDQLTENTPEEHIRNIRKKIIELFWEEPIKQSSELPTNYFYSEEMTAQQMLEGSLSTIIS